ncbi:MAG TPA: CBS domain-containing protein [Accumulibacter sp.]|nr:CBS domain-containing protein [Accumulibacter sp.]
MIFFASLLGQAVRGKANEIIGLLDDVIVQVGDDLYPPITGLVVRDRRRQFFVAASQLESFNGAIRLGTSTVNLRPFLRRDGEILLGKDVLDHQIIDISGRRIVRVNDVQLAQIERVYRIVGVDVSAKAFLRRLGPRSLAHRIVGRQIIDWQEAQYLASDAPVRLKVSYDRLSEMNPVDLGRIVDALSFRESAEIVAALDNETVAETLEEVSDERVADLLEGMDKERAADILEEMNPGAAADALEDLDRDLAEQILARMEPEEAAEIQEMLAYDEDSVGRIMRSDFVHVAEDASVGSALALLRAMDEVPDPLPAIYVVTRQQESGHETNTSEERLGFRGIVRLRSLIVAKPETQMVEIMEDDLPTINHSAKAEDATRLLAEYNLLAIPVLDDTDSMIGIVTVDDALAVLLPEIWQRRRENVFS